MINKKRSKEALSSEHLGFHLLSGMVRHSALIQALRDRSMWISVYLKFVASQGYKAVSGQPGLHSETLSQKKSKAS